MIVHIRQSDILSTSLQGYDCDRRYMSQFKGGVSVLIIFHLFGTWDVVMRDLACEFTPHLGYAKLEVPTGWFQ